MTPEHVKLEIAFRDAIAASDDDAALAAGLRILEALAVLGRQLAECQEKLGESRNYSGTLSDDIADVQLQLAEKDEALREALRLRNEAYVSTPVRDDTRNAHFALQALGQILREALRTEPAKEEA